MPLLTYDVIAYALLRKITTIEKNNLIYHEQIQNLLKF